MDKDLKDKYNEDSINFFSAIFLILILKIPPPSWYYRLDKVKSPHNYKTAELQNHDSLILNISQYKRISIH